MFYNTGSVRMNLCVCKSLILYISDSIYSFVFLSSVIPDDDCKLVETLNQLWCPLFCTL